MSFQKNVLIISTVILLFMLLVIAYILYKAQQTTRWPPEVGQCPDYWKVTGQNQCENVQNLGNGTCGRTQDFTGPEWQGIGGYKKKAEWAKDCGIVWDGISDGKYQELENGTGIYTQDVVTEAGQMFGSMFKKAGSTLEQQFYKTTSELATN
jgi:hypothetical protein